MRLKSPWLGIALGIAGLGTTWACGGSEFGKAGSGAKDGGVEDGGEPSTGDGGARTGSGGRAPTGGSRTGGRSTGSGGSAAGAVGSGGTAAGGTGTGGTTGSGGGTAGRTGSGGAMGAGGAPGSGGVVGAGGTAGSGGQTGAGGAVSATQCGGFLGVQCEGNEWCDYEDASECGAGDVPGVCKPRPDTCDSSQRPVCGCDGTYYSNPCMANGAGFDVSSDTSCFPGGPGSNCNTDGECQPGLKCCYPCGIQGCQNQCMVVTGPFCPLFP